MTAVTFFGAERELKDDVSKLDQTKIITELNKSQIQWMFNPPKIQWMGGSMEILVKITKGCLKAAVKNGLLQEDTLYTILIETESLENSRPLTSVGDDIDDLEPLTPNHFLISRSSRNTNFANITEKNVNSRTKWKSVKAVIIMYRKH